ERERKRGRVRAADELQVQDCDVEVERASLKAPRERVWKGHVKRREQHARDLGSVTSRLDDAPQRIDRSRDLLARLRGVATRWLGVLTRAREEGVAKVEILVVLGV